MQFGHRVWSLATLHGTVNRYTPTAMTFIISLRMCWSPHLYIAVDSTRFPPMATRLTLKVQLGQGIVGNPECCCVSVVQAVVGAPALKATACLKHRAERTRRNARTVDIAVEIELFVDTNARPSSIALLYMLCLRDCRGLVMCSRVGLRTPLRMRL